MVNDENNFKEEVDLEATNEKDVVYNLPPLPESDDITLRSDATVILRDSMGTEDGIVEVARVSTAGANSKDSEGRKGLIRYLYREAHGTPFESCVMRVYLEFPVFTSRQVVKHRLTSINEESGRYREMEGVFYVVPEGRPLVQVGKTSEYIFEQGTELQLHSVQWVQRSTAIAAWDNYRSLLDLGICKEVARQHLPFTLYSSMYLTANLRSILNFISLRKDWGESAIHRSKAQWEISLVAEQLAKLVKDQYPTVWECFVDNGYRAV